MEVKIKNRRKGEGEVGNEGIFEQGVNECVCINGMEWNENVCETEGPKIERQKKQRRILPTWILEGKKSTPKDTENTNSVAEKNNSRIKDMFKLQKEKIINELEENKKFPLKLTTNLNKKKNKLGLSSAKLRSNCASYLLPFGVA